jgi:hypothetical protein
MAFFDENGVLVKKSQFDGMGLGPLSPSNRLDQRFAQRRQQPGEGDGMAVLRPRWPSARTGNNLWQKFANPLS